MGVAFMLLTFLALLAAAGAAVFGLRKHRPRLVLGALFGAGAWGALYLAGLLATSLASDDRLLGWHHPKPFCGFYIDCHVSVSVEGVTTTPAIGEGAHRVTAEGMFYVVTLRYSSNAIRAPLSTGSPAATIRDDQGRMYSRASEAEAVLTSTLEHPAPLPRTLAPGESVTTQIVFDLPPEAPAPRLYVRQGFGIDRLVELFLIGDEDSLLHRRTWFWLGNTG